MTLTPGTPLWSRLILTGLTLLGISLVFPRPVQASGTITNCTEADLHLALRGGGFVILACDSTITLSSTLVISKETVLDGTGHTPTLTSGQFTNSGPIFVVQPGASLMLRNLTVSNGRLVGTNAINGNSAQPTFGAAIYSDHGIVTLDGCTLSGHSVLGGNGAVGTSNNNPAGIGGEAGGAAVYNVGGQLMVTNSVFSGNSAVGGTGGNGSNSSFGGNGGSGGQGGDGGLAVGAALVNAANGSVSIFSSTFSSNSVTGSPGGTGGTPSGLLAFPGDNGKSGAGLGAAIYNASGTISIVNSTFVGNTGLGATGLAGAAGSGSQQGQDGSPGGTAQGGAVCNGAGSLALTNCVFVDNALTGGTGGAGGAGPTLIFGGDGASGGTGGAALGAGLFASAGSTLVVNCTFSDNHVVGGPGGPGGPGGGVGSNGPNGATGAALGGALFDQGGTVNLKNSILANSAPGSNAGGSISDQGFNISSDATPVLTAPGSRNGIDPLLGSYVTLGNISTLTLSSNSPAINAITAPDENGAPVFDQRNFFRVTPFDIGAYELNGVVTAPSFQAQLQNSQLLLTWPNTGSFNVQTTTNIANTNSWITLVAQPTNSASVSTLAVSPTNSAAFFRLISR
jgi:hypothetical protein